MIGSIAIATLAFVCGIVVGLLVAIICLYGDSAPADPPQWIYITPPAGTMMMVIGDEL